MARGGRRLGAGGVSKWNHGKTKTIRVPEQLAEEILTFARALDEGRSITISAKSTSDAVTDSKVLNLSGIKIRADRDGVVIRLDDLVKAGYRIYPERLAKSLEPVLKASSKGS